MLRAVPQTGYCEFEYRGVRYYLDANDTYTACGFNQSYTCEVAGVDFEKGIVYIDER